MEPTNLNAIIVSNQNTSLSPSNSSLKNDTDLYGQDDYIFDRTDVRIIFITLYAVVFCCCFFGNLLVILVVTLSRRLRSITNFFLANLAVADFCVGVFCVFQNLSMYLIPTWVLGDFLCKMYQFIHSLSYTASIFILVVICIERYFAIIYPITCKQILSPTRLRIMIGAVWMTSALYSAPRFFWVQTIENHMHDGSTEIICATHRKRYNSKLFDIINFVFLYVIPLVVMTVLYTRIAIGLWRSSNQLEKHLNASISFTSPASISCELSHSSLYTPQMQVQRKLLTIQRSPTVINKHHVSKSKEDANSTSVVTLPQHPNPSQNVLRARRGVIRMLIVVVLTFALCNLPFHARKMWQYWSSGYSGASNFSTLFTPLTFLITYFNSGINPLLYAFLSRNFRRGMQELILCSIHNSSTRHTQNHKQQNFTKSNRAGSSHLQRQTSTRSTIKATATTVSIVNNTNSEDYSQKV